jgi:hypothetical protein
MDLTMEEQKEPTYPRRIRNWSPPPGGGGVKPLPPQTTMFSKKTLSRNSELLSLENAD